MLITKLLRDRSYQYMAPIMASGKGDVEKIWGQFRSTVFPEYETQMKEYFEKVQKQFQKLKGKTFRAMVG